MTLQVTNLVGGYSQIPVLKEVTFDVQNGELVGLIGLNGAGKSTTINHIIGLLTPFKGEIKINGITLNQDKNAYKKTDCLHSRNPDSLPGTDPKRTSGNDHDGV